MNIDLGRAVLETLSANPNKHDQGTWVRPGSGVDDPLADNACGTAGCIAGWTVEIAGNNIRTVVPLANDDGRFYYATTIGGVSNFEFFRQDWKEHKEEYLEMMSECISYNTDYVYYEEHHEDSDAASSWTLVAARLLGITLDEADNLFSGGRTGPEAREELARLIDAAVAEEKRKAEEGELGDG